MLLLGGSVRTDCDLNSAAVGCKKDRLINGPLYNAESGMDTFVPPRSLYLFWGASSAIGTIANSFKGTVTLTNGF